MDGDTRARIRIASALGAIAVVGLAHGCAGTVGTTAASMLRKVQESPDPNIRYQAYAKLASDRAYENDAQKAEAAKLLADRLVTGKEPDASRAVICHTLGELRQPVGREVLLRALGDPNEAVRHSACRALGKVGKTEDWTVLARIMATDADRDNQVAAIEGLAALKPADARADAFLVDGMENSDAAIRLASYRALCAISGKDLGVDPAPWKKYAEERAKGVDNSSTPPAEIAAPATTIRR